MDSSNVTGPLALGYMLGFILYGVFVLQLSFYTTRFAKDPNSIKALVWGVFVLGTIVTVFSSIGAWDSFGTNWGDVESLRRFHWSWMVILLGDGLIAPAVQLFFAWRVFRVSDKIWAPIPIIITSFLQFFATYYVVIGTLAHGGTVEKFKSYTPIIDLGLASTFICNIMIAAMITFMTMLNSSINVSFVQICHLVAESNAATALGSMIQLILWRTMPNNSFHFMFFLILGRLYSNVLLFALNSRVQYSAFYSGHFAASRDGATLWADVSRHNATMDSDMNRRNSVNVNPVKAVNIYADNALPKPSYKDTSRVLRFDDSSV